MWRFTFLLLIASSAASASEPHTAFKDCETCPEMVPIPTGGFLMGEPESADPEPLPGWGGPPAQIDITRPFAMARTETTNAQFGAFVAATGHQISSPCRSVWSDQEATWQDPGWPGSRSKGRDHPVVCVGFEDARAYVDWLNELAADERSYDLPSEAQFEYAARAGNRDATPWASAGQPCDFANVADRRFRTKNQTLPFVDCDDGFPFTAPAGNYPPNAFGLYDMLGNVWEWTLDCSSADLTALPRDGSSHRGLGAGCPGRQTRGGGFVSSTQWLRYSARGGLHTVPGTNNVALGFRVVAYDRP